MKAPQPVGAGSPQHVMKASQPIGVGTHQPAGVGRPLTLMTCRCREVCGCVEAHGVWGIGRPSTLMTPGGRMPSSLRAQVYFPLLLSSERWREIETVCVCVRETERAYLCVRERVCVRVCERERESVCVYSGDACRPRYEPRFISPLLFIS